jgi:hypothetical protein
MLTVGDAFERFGSNVALAFGNIRTLFNSLKQAVFGFFNDLLGSALQNLVRGTLGGLFSSGGSLARIFGGAGGGISAPPSVSFGPIGFGQGLSPVEAASGFKFQAQPAFGNFSLSGLGKSLAGAAPFLGLSLGSGLGGQSIAGNILGSAGGFLTGGFLAATLTPGVFSAGAAALLSNPFTAIAGAGLLVGSILLGKAKQRKSDEQASGEFLRQALDALEQLRAGVASGSIEGSQARSIFDSQILGTFVQQINTLKTKSVRESRLTNQVRDLRNVYEAIIPPAIAQQAQARATSASNALAFSRQIPEFATGGTTLGGLAILHPGEKVLNLQQQSRMREIAGVNVFERAGVPGLNTTGRFDNGGTFSGSVSEPMVVEVAVHVGLGKNDTQQIFVSGGSSDRGRQVIVRGVKDARTNREM